MKPDEFAFFNRQLAGMLKDGIPLEGALKQLCASMGNGSLKAELQKLREDLAEGTPLREALAARKLPEFYVRMLEIGAKSNNLPDVLLMLADYYQRVNSIWVRLKGLMVYPLIVLAMALALCLVITFFCTTSAGDAFGSLLGGASIPGRFVVFFWLPLVVIGFAFLFMLGALLVPRARRHLRWRLPAFKEAGLSQVASAMGLMLKGGSNLSDALKLVAELEKDTPAGGELLRWQTALADGRGRFMDIAQPGRAFPPMFIWMVGSGREDLADGFNRAAESYHVQAVHQVEMLLYVVFPMTIVFLGMMILCQVYSYTWIIFRLINTLGS